MGESCLLNEAVYLHVLSPLKPVYLDTFRLIALALNTSSVPTSIKVANLIHIVW